MAAQLAVEVVLPELGKPDVAPVVVQRAAGEVSVEPWQGTGVSGPPPCPPHTHPDTERSGARRGKGRPLTWGQAAKKTQNTASFYAMQNEKSLARSQRSACDSGPQPAWQRCPHGSVWAHGGHLVREGRESPRANSKTRLCTCPWSRTFPLLTSTCSSALCKLPSSLPAQAALPQDWHLQDSALSSCPETL